MSRANSGLAVLLTAAWLVCPAGAGADTLRGVLRLEPLSADLAELGAERPALVRVPSERGPLFPYVDADRVRVAVQGVAPLIVLGGPCPASRPLGVMPVIENPGVESQALLVGGAAETILIEPGQRVALVAPPSNATDPEAPLRLSVPEGDWSCEISLGSDAAVTVAPRRVSPAELAVEIGGVAFVQPDGTTTPPDTLSLRIWLDDRPLCPAAARDEADCSWRVTLLADGTFEAVSLDIDELYGATEDY